MGAARIQARKRSYAPAVPAPVTEKSVRRQLSLAVGTERFQHRDPIYHLTESFRQTFDEIGRMRVRGERPDPSALAERYFMREEVPGLEESAGMRPSVPGARTEAGRDTGDGDLPDPTDMTSLYRPRDPQRRMMDRFAQVTFQRGSLSAALLRGQGKMMLFSCLNRTAGQERSKQERERMLFQRSSSHKHVPGQQGDIAVVNKGFTDSAVGLVVDVLKNARETVESFQAIAEGKTGTAGMGTVQKQYPFLTDAGERELLAEYRTRLAQLSSPGCEEERAVLTRAQEKAEAVIQKKSQMKRDFMQKLHWLALCAADAEKEFSQEEFRWEAFRQLLEPEEPEDVPPPDGEDGAGGADDGGGGEDVGNGAPDILQSEQD